MASGRQEVRIPSAPVLVENREFSVSNIVMVKLSPDPGALPSLPSPREGETIRLTIDGEPPHKDVHFSIRNLKHRRYESFSKLRNAAIDAMKGRRWYDGPVQLDITLFAPTLQKNLIDYMGGIMDTLDGSHGATYTYLPVAYQDDCQVVTGQTKFVKSKETKYQLTITFLSKTRSRR